MATVGSLFSGIGGFDLGLERAGWDLAWQSEIETHASACLAAHWPAVPNLGDVSKIEWERVESVDLICGGFPCQDISKLGPRTGLAGKRSGLWWYFWLGLERLRPEWCVIENVPGLLTSNRGADLAAILRALGQLGYGWAYRVLDAQHFGVPQRRHRLFIVGHLGANGPVKLLAESPRGARDTGPNGKTRTVAGAFTASSLGGTGGADENAVKARFVFPRVIDGQIEMRKMMPVEVERLMGFPDNWTAGAKTHRYRMLGNAVVPAMAEWIGEYVVS